MNVPQLDHLDPQLTGSLRTLPARGSVELVATVVVFLFGDGNMSSQGSGKIKALLTQPRVGIDALDLVEAYEAEPS